jgi:F-type H+-transporting ATPase subunit a
MGDISHMEQIVLFEGLGAFGLLNIGTVRNTLMVMGVLVFLGLFVRLTYNRRVPGRVQGAFELLIGMFDTLVTDSLEYEDKARNRAFTPLIVVLFMFLCLSNFWGFIPGMHEPTADLCTTLALGVMGFIIALYVVLKRLGFMGYMHELAHPMIFMWPLNVIGELAKIVSISFRLFGNIKGGAIIIMVIGWLVNYWVMPVPVNAFFVFFVGTVQAFVFTMLTLTYISVSAK